MDGVRATLELLDVGWMNADALRCDIESEETARIKMHLDIILLLEPTGILCIDLWSQLLAFIAALRVREASKLDQQENLLGRSIADELFEIHPRLLNCQPRLRNLQRRQPRLSNLQHRQLLPSILLSSSSARFRRLCCVVVGFV